MATSFIRSRLHWGGDDSYSVVGNKGIVVADLSGHYLSRHNLSGPTEDGGFVISNGVGFGELNGDGVKHIVDDVCWITDGHVFGG